jgi:hypothetical protein
MSAVGDSITYDGQRYECVKIKRYTAKNGQPASFSIWQSECAVEGCTNILQQNFPPNFPRRTVNLNRRCAMHRQPGVPLHGGRSPRPPTDNSVKAAAWLHGYIKRHVELRPSTRFIIDAAVQDYPNMPPGVAVALGSEAPTEKHRYAIVHKRLQLAEQTGIMCYNRDPAGSYWGYGARDPDASLWD